MFDKNPNLLQFASIDRNLLDIAGLEKLAMYGLTDQARIQHQLGSKNNTVSYWMNSHQPVKKNPEISATLRMTKQDYSTQD